MTDKGERVRAELLETLAFVHSAHNNAIMILVKSLEESGALQREHYEANLRMYSESLPLAGPVKQLLSDLADLMVSADEEGSA